MGQDSPGGMTCKFKKIQCSVLKVQICTEMAQWLSWLERRPVTAKVVGSSPIWVVAITLVVVPQ